jgi:hypothetical protein
VSTNLIPYEDEEEAADEKDVPKQEDETQETDCIDLEALD